MREEATTGEACALCGRMVSTTSRHHLTPMQKGGKDKPTIPLCQPCHKTIHTNFSNTELAREYNSVEALKGAERLETYLSWIKDKTIEKLVVKPPQKRR